MKTAALLLACLLSISSVAQPPPPARPTHIQAGSKVYIEPMDGFETYLSAAIISKKVPLTIVGERARADYVISGNSQVDKAGWAKMIIAKSGSSLPTSITVKDAKTGDLVYAYAVDKYNSVREGRAPQRACAKHMKQDIESASKW